MISIDIYNECDIIRGRFIVLRWLIKLLKTISVKINLKTKQTEKRGRNLLLTEMKSVNIPFKPNSSKRGRNLLINAYRMSDWENNDKK